MKREYSDIGGIQQQAADIIRQAYDKGYKAGYANGKDEAYKNPVPTFAVGDEVYSDAFDDKGIITYITADKVSCVCIICSGSTMMKVGTIGLHKTGRHFPQIAEVLDQMKGSEHDGKDT